MLVPPVVAWSFVQSFTVTNDEDVLAALDAINSGLLRTLRAFSCAMLGTLNASHIDAS